MGRKKIAQQLFARQQERLKLMRMQEREKAVTEDAKYNFHRPVYPGLFSKQDRCGNSLGGRE